jgi:hypothetical protein
MDQPVGMESREMKRGGEKVAPSEAPEDRTFTPSQDAGKEDRRARIIGEFGAARHLVQSAGRDPPGGDSRVDIFDAERDDVMTRGNAFDLRDFGANIFEDRWCVHGYG